MAHAAAGNDGTASIAGVLVTRLIEWEAEERAVEVTDTACGDAAVSRIFPRIDWTARIRGQVMPTSTASQGGVPSPGSVIGVATAIIGKRKTGDASAVFTATGAVTRFRYTSGGPDGVQEFEAEVGSSEGTVPTWVFS